MVLGHYYRRFLSQARWRAGCLLGLVLISGVAEGVGLLMILPFLDVAGIIETATRWPRVVTWLVSIWPSQIVPLNLLSALSAFLILVALKAALGWLRVFVQVRVASDFGRLLRDQFYGGLIAAPWTLVARLRRAELQQHIQRDTREVEAVIAEGFTVCSVGFLGLIYGGVALQLAPLLTVLSVGAALVIGLCLLPVKRRIERAALGLRTGVRGVFERMEERISMLKVIKSFGREHQELREFRGLTDDMRRQLIHASDSAALVPVAYSVLGAAFLSSFIYLGVSQFGLPGERILVLVFIFARMLAFANQLQRSVNTFARTAPGLRALYERERELERCAESLPSAEESDRLRLVNQIRVEQVSFRYPGETSEVLRDVSLVLPANSIIALAGPSGAGKTTMADLILGLLEPSSGRVEIDGLTLDTKAVKRWRRSVAYMPQEHHLLHDSIRANLLWANGNATDEVLWSALEQASAGEFVRNLPDRLETVIGSRGDRLSGGERQRLSLARSLLCLPDLLVLDEPTSSIDDQNAAAVLKTLHSLKESMTILLIAHSPQALAVADRVVRLEKGRLVRVDSRSDRSGA